MRRDVAAAHEMRIGIKPDNHRRSQITDAALGAVEHARRPALTGPWAPRNHRLPAIVEPKQGDPVVDSIPSQVNLLTRLRRSLWSGWRRCRRVRSGRPPRSDETKFFRAK